VNEYKLPDVGEGLTEAEIVSWKVKPGDVIKVNDVVCEIETAKSIVELPSPYAGTIEELLVAEGETVDVGMPIIRIGDGSAAPASSSAEPAEAVATPPDDAAVEPGVAGSPAPKEEKQPTLVGYGPREASSKRRPRKGRATPESDAGESAQEQLQGAFAPGAEPEQMPDPGDTAEPPVPATPARPAQEQPRPAGSTRALAKPPVRKLAKDLGVDLATVTPSGPNGTVTRDDVQQAGSQPAPGSTSERAASVGQPGAGRPSGERETRTPIKGVRKMTAQAMKDSAFTAPHVTEWITVDVTRTVELVEKLRGMREFRDVKVSPLLVVAKAVCLAVRRTPAVNATWDEAAQEIVTRHYVNLGIAAATPRGLVVPNVKDADGMGLRELADAIGALTQTAREGKTQPAEMSGGSFTITNVGVFGVDAGTPILNPGESGILCFGAIRKQPWVVTADGVDAIVPRHITTLALSFDHRIVDGEQGSRFLADVAAILEDPGTALLY